MSQHLHGVFYFMRRIFKLSAAFVAASIVSACTPDDIIPTTAVPSAGVRFINAVPDTNPMDFRFVDLVENSAHFKITFRNNVVTTVGVPASTLIQFKPAKVGSRHFRIFLNDTSQVVASTVLKDTTVTINEGSRYTAILWGNGRGAAPGIPFLFIEETPPDPGAGNVALRVINATTSAIDVRQFADPNGTGVVPAACTAPACWDDVAPLTATAWVIVPADTIRFNVQPGVGGTALFPNPRALLGFPTAISGAGTGGAPVPCNPATQTCDTEALPGTTIPGSAVTAIVFPGSQACSNAPQTNVFLFTTGNTATLSATAGGYARSAGSFITDGIAAGMTVTACGFLQPENNGSSTVAAVTATTLTVTKAVGPIVEAGSTGSTTLAATATGYSRPAGDFIADGFRVGMPINATGFGIATNNGPSTITAVTATDLTVTKPGTPLAAEAAAAGRTITNTSTRFIGAPRPAISFMWDRRPPRPAGM